MMKNRHIFCCVFIALFSFMLIGCSLLNDNVGDVNDTNKIKNEKQITEVSEKPVNSKAADKSVDKVADSAVKNIKSEENAILIKKSEYRLIMVKDGQVVLDTKCAVGKNPGQKTKRGDLKTPVGTFYVDEIIDSSYWTHDFGDGKGEIEGAYGPWFISLDTMPLSKGEWDGIGIHGTHDNSSLGTNASEGCIRIKNEDVEKLKGLVSVGTKVVIEE